MVGTAIIAIVGYGLSISFALAALLCPGAIKKAKQRGDMQAATDERHAFFGCIIFSIGLAALTRWLNGGQF